MEVDPPSDTLFSCMDPEGRLITARRQRWEEHIQARHPEIAAHDESVRVTLEAPDVIVSDFDNPAGLNYYRLGILPPPFDELYLKVVVNFTEINATVFGDVITAYPAGKIARGEVQQWP